MKSEQIQNKNIEHSPDALISPFFETDWKPAPYKQLKNEEHRAALRNSGYFVFKNFFKPETIAALNQLYAKHDHVGINDIGMFMSAYSDDIAYRKDVHHRIGEIIEPELHQIFTSFKPVLYNFVIKESRPEHSFKLHSDLSLIDEHVGSPINIWVSMMDIRMENGPLRLIPKTQYFLPAHRSPNADSEIHAVEDQLKQYAVDMCLDKGDLLIFDSRLIHGSSPNTSGKDRMAAVGHICPQDAPFTMLAKSASGKENEFEVRHFEREDLFASQSFEAANKSHFHGKASSTVVLNRIHIDPKALDAYFKRVQVPVTKELIRDEITQKASVSVRKEPSRIYALVKKFFSSLKD